MRTATPSYWLTWRFLILGSGLLVIAGISVLIIWKFEGSPKSGNQERDSKKKRVGDLYKDEAWTPCHKAIHPAWLLAYRLLAFIFLLSMLASDVFLNSTDIFFFYTQWTFSSVTLYFGLGSFLSIHGVSNIERVLLVQKFVVLMKRETMLQLLRGMQVYLAYPRA